MAMVRGWAFFAVTLLSAGLVVHCGSSTVMPPLATNTVEDSGGSAPPPPKDTGTDAPSIPDATVTDAFTPTGPASAMSLSPNTLNFGPVPCGTTANPQTVQVINNSGATVSLALYFVQNSGYFTATFKDPVSGQNLGNSMPSLVPSQAVSLVVTPAPIPKAPQSANTAGGYKDTLQLVVNGGNNTANAIPVQEGAEGVIFSFGTSAVTFGSVPVGSKSAGQNVLVTNNGSQAASFLLTASSLDDAGVNPFVVTEPTGPLAPGATATLSVTFAPTTAAPSAGTITLTQTDSTPLCGPLPSAGITLSGTGVSGTVGIEPGALAFGNVNCGTAAPQQGIYLSNVGTATYHWTAALTAGASFYSVSPLSGDVLPNTPSQYGVDGGVPTITITPNSIPANGGSVSPDGYDGKLTITTTDPQDLNPPPIPLTMTANGAIIALSPSGTFNFQNWAVGQTESQTLNFINSGNAAATINLGATLPFGAPASVIVPGPSTTPVTLTFTPTAAQGFTGALTLNAGAGTTLCSALPGGSSGITLQGVGVTPVPPTASLTSNSINFGSVPCGSTTALPISVSVQNTGAIPFQVSPSLQNGAGSIFKASLAASADGGTFVSPGSQTTVTVSLPQMRTTASITPDAYADVLSLLITSANGSAITDNVPIHVTASGAIMAFQPSALDFGTVPVNSTTSLPFSVVNSGNAPAEVDLQFAGGSGDGGSVSQFGRNPLGLVNVTGNASVGLQASFSAADTTAQSGALQMVPSSKPSNSFCAPMPSPLSLSGQGSNSTTVVTPTSIDFGLTNCGTQAGKSTVTIQNTASTGSVSWSAKFLSGGSYYQLSSSSGTVTAKSSATFDVIPNQLATTSPITPDFYAATLQVTSGTTNQTQLIQIHQTARGVILATTGNGSTNFGQLNFGGVSVNQTATAQFTITNNGNVGVAGVQLSNSNAAFAVNPVPAGADAGATNQQLLAFDLAPQQSIVPEVTFTPPQVQTYNDTAVYTIPTGTVLCQPAPPNFTLNGSGNTGIAVSPTSLNFGLVQCGSVPPSGQQITISNKGGAAQWSGTFGRGVQNLPSYYQLQDTLGNVIKPGALQPLPGGSVVPIVIVPNPIAAPASTNPNAFSDSLTIQTTAPGDNPHVVSINETAQGAFLTLSPQSIGGNPNGLGGTGTEGFSITNSGNLTASYYVTVTLQQGNDTKTTYPTTPAPCQTYTASNPYPNQCAPPGSCINTNTGNTPYSIVLPEFCTNLAYTAGAPGSLFGGQTASGVIESTGYPQAGFTQALGYITLVPQNTILCSDPVPNIPLSEPAFNP